MTLLNHWLQKKTFIFNFLPSHSSHLLQALDKYLFANVKRFYYSNKIFDENMDRIGKNIPKILKTFYSACTPFTNRSSFKAIGMRSIWNENGEFIRIEIDFQLFYLIIHDDKEDKYLILFQPFLHY